MMAVPRQSGHAADEAAKTPVNGAVEPPSEPLETAENGSLALSPKALPPQTDDRARAKQPIEAHAADGPGPQLPADPGLYAVFGLSPSVSDGEIQTTYRRQAARLGSGAHDNAALRRLNTAYEVLGNPVRRAEYDRSRLAQSSAGPPTPIRLGAKATAQVTRRRRPRHAVQPRYAGLGDVMVVLVVVAVAVLAGAFIILPRLSVNLSALNVLQNVLPLSNSSRRVIDATVTPAPATPAPSPTPRPGTAQRFLGSTVAVSNAAPAQNAQETVMIRLRRDNQPAANLDVWATVKYRTTEERWPPTGSIKTDSAGAATIAFNVGAATPNFPVQVQVFAQVDDQQLSWSTTFTPH